MERFGWLPEEWRQYGARWGKDNRLYLAEWRHGFEVHQLRALFYDSQQIRALRGDLKAAQEEIERLEGLASRRVSDGLHSTMNRVEHSPPDWEIKITRRR